MKNYLQQRGKSLLAFAVGLTILSSSFAGKVYADEGYISWNDLKMIPTLPGPRIKLIMKVVT